MLLLGEIASHDTAHTVCTTSFNTDASALLGGSATGIPSTFALELIAQAMAVHDGLRRQAERRPPASSGFLLGSRRFELLVRQLPLETKLSVVVSAGTADPGSNLVRFQGRVETWEGAILAFGDATVLEQRVELTVVR